MNQNKYLKNLFSEKGITLIVLVVSVVVMLILAVITIEIAIQKDGLISKTKEGAFKSEVSQIEQEVIQKVKINEKKNPDTIINGDLSNILEGSDLFNKYMEKLYIKDNKLVYISDECTDKEKLWLQQLGINERND